VPLNRRHFLMGAASAAFAATKPAQTPNILLIVADDLASWMLGCYGNQEIHTPNIDTLARSGMRFINSFCCSPICSPSRATLLTGRLPQQHGIEDFLTPQPIAHPPQGQADAPASFANEVMLSDILFARGYNCGHVGKWHMGHDEQPGHGLQYTYTMSGGSRSYRDPEMFLNGKSVQEQGYLTDLMTKRSCDFLDRQTANKPFFLTTAYLNPHTPYEGHPQKYYDMYSKTIFDTFGWERAAPNALREKNMLTDIVGNIRKCAASTTALDDQVPVLLRKLRERNLLDNTIVVFTGDNGYLLGRHGLWSKGLASDPINMYEEVMGVPMLWSWPGHIPAEASRPDLISFYDFVPTICDITGSALPSGRNLIGRSYAALAQNQPLPKKQPWKQTVFGHFRNTEMVRNTRYKLVLRNDGTGPNELWDIANDPREKTNQYENARFITIRDQLHRELDGWKKRVAS
jgi:arylsulfatase A-like enzyme